MRSRSPDVDFVGGERGAVVVVGAGAAGMGAAIAAARAGARVVLVEAAPAVGGTVAHALIHTLGGIFDLRGQRINDGLVGELVDRFDASETRLRRIGRTQCWTVCPNAYRQVVERWLNDEERLELLCDARVGCLGQAGPNVHEIEVVTSRGPRKLPVRALIDTTGTAEIVRMLDSRFVYDDDDRAAAGLIFRLRGVQPGSLAFPHALAHLRRLREAADRGELPATCQHAWLDQGVYDDEAFVKLFVPVEGEWRDPRRIDDLTASAQGTRDRLADFLRQTPEFSTARITQTGALGIRDGGRIRGEYYLTTEDVRSCRKFADAACRCCWPIEYWHPQQGLELEYLPESDYYEIPLRALRVRGLRNVWAAGKCLSADHRAQSSARVAGQCWAMGEAVGRAAAK